MKFIHRTVSALLLVICCVALVEAQAGFYLREGDRVVFYGDSITQQRLYTLFVEEYVLTRFPAMNVAFIHSGVGGDRVSGGGSGSIDIRLKRDVIAYQPTVVTIMLGMNDAGYRPFDQPILDAYAKGYSNIIQTLAGALPNLRVTLIQPSPFDDVTRPPQFAGGYNGVLKRYGEFVRELGAKHKFTVADLNGGVVAALEKAYAADAATAKLFIPDRVHPEAAGHWLMAAELLKAWNAPAIVTAVEIDAERGRVARGENTEVSELKMTDEEISWTQLDRALPLPFVMQDETIALMLKVSDLVPRLNQQPLLVKGLKPGRYKLLIDDREFGAYSNEELSSGVNLALLRTPMAQQAMTVHWATEEHNNIHDTRFRLLVHGDKVPGAAEAAQAMDALESLIVKRQRANAQPKPHHYKLRKM